MNLKSTWMKLDRLQFGPDRLIRLIIAIVLSIGAGASYLVFPSVYSPLIFAGLVAGTSILILWFSRPVLALYTAVFVALLPTGLIPANIQSLLNRSLTVIAFATWLFDTLVSRRRSILRSSTMLMLGFILWSGLTLLWAANVSAGLTVLQTYLLRLILYLFLMVDQIRTKASLNGLMKTLALNGFVLAVIGIEAALSGGYVPGTRLQVLNANENSLGVLALLALIGVLWQTMQPEVGHKPLKEFVAVAYLVSAIVMVGLSGSRGSAISLLIILLSFALWRVTRRWAILSLVLLASAVASALFATTLVRFVSEAGNTPLGVREILWQAAWQLISRHPWVGVGIGNSLYQALPFLNTFGGVVGKASASIHNPILVVWSETGILGILLYLGVIVSAVCSFVMQYFRYRKLDAQGRFIPYFALVASVFLGYMASWIKGGGMQTDHSFFLLLGLLLIPSGLDISKVLDANG